MSEPSREEASPPPHAPSVPKFRPYIPAIAKLRELTPVPLILGTILGCVFGASSLYLVLKVGLTVSASIPVAVISITFFRVFSKLGSKNATILENNIVQTAGSAGESIAFGVGVTMPAIMILGFDLEVSRVLLVGCLGGILGILMMIPLRRALIVEQHGTLKYPEGTACAEVLKAGASDESRAAAAAGGDASQEDASSAGAGAVIFTGFGVGLIYKAAEAAFKMWKEYPEKIFGAPLKGGSISAEISPELLGVGYIIGPKISATMCAGGVLAYLVLVPMIKFFGSHGPILEPADQFIAAMSPDDIRSAYVLYIGAGAVAAGGIISLVRSLPTIWRGLKHGLKDLDFGKKKKGAAAGAVPRTDRDLSMKVVLIGAVVLVAAIVLARPLQMNVIGAVMIVVFGFLFVTVSSRLTGEIGSSSNPISGMTVATLLITCLIFLVVGWTAPSPYYVTALSVGAIVCIAASNGGTTSQDLKTGYLIGATPRRQQIAIVVGTLASALMLGPILMRLNATSTVYAPQVIAEPVSKDLEKKTVPDAASLPLYTGEAVRGAVRYHLLSIAPPKTGEEAEKALEDEEAIPPGDYLVTEEGQLARKINESFPRELRANPTALEAKEPIEGPQAKDDPKEYFVWHKRDDVGGKAGKYLVDDDGVPVYLVDPGVNGTHRFRPSGPNGEEVTEIPKYGAPTATLMSYIIKGILSQKLPWALVLLGVMIAIVLEMTGIPSLAFAVGVYLPLSSSTPILVGGVVRGLVDRYVRKKHAGKKMTEEELVAEGDKSRGVLLASGYIAGGAITGILIAFLTGAFGDTLDSIGEWMQANNPLQRAGLGDALSMIPFTLLTLFLFLVGREVMMRPKSRT